MIITDRIKQVANIVCDNKFKISKLFSGKKFELPISTTTLVEPKKEFKGVITDFVTNEFLPTNIEMERFIQLVYSSFELAINLYCERKKISTNDIFFVYKGGNILRFVAYQVMYELGGIMSDIINEYYNTAFKKSDADFSIYINPKLANYDDVFLDMNNLAFLVQNELRNEFMQNLNKYFKYYDLNEKKRKEILSGYLTKLNETENIREKKYDYDGKFIGISFEETSVGEIDEFIPKSDFYVDYDTEYDLYIESSEFKFPKPTFYRKLKLLHEDNKTQFDSLTQMQNQVYSNTKYPSLMVSSNQTLDFMKEKNRIVFSLVRTKVIFNAMYKSHTDNSTTQIKIDGELIDVSISHRNDTVIQHYFDHVKQNVSTYHIKDFTFKAPSLLYLIQDIEKMLYADNKYPWSDVKYAKRLNRVLFMYFVLLLTNTKISYDKKAEYMRNIQREIVNKFDTKPTNTIDTFLNSHIDTDPFYILIENLKKILSYDDVDKVKLQDYLKVISNNIDVLAGIVPNIAERCAMQGLQQNRIMQSSEMRGGVGENFEYYQKYLEYKKRYAKF